MKLEGEIAELDLVARLVELGGDQFTGAIRFEHDGIIKILYFKGGDILSASTNDRADSIDEILMRANKVSREHVKQALAKRKESETLGDALLTLGFITRKELTWARRVQVIGVIRSIMNWGAGSYTVVADYLPKREEGTLFPLPQIVVELIVTEQDRAQIERALDGGNAVFSKAPAFDDRFARLGLNQDAEGIVSEIDGMRTASQIASVSGKDAFNVYKLLHALATLGLIQQDIIKPRTNMFDEPDDLGFANAGVADAADAWDDPTPALQASPSQFSFEPTVETPVPSFDETEHYAPPSAPTERIAPMTMPAWDSPASSRAAREMPPTAPVPSLSVAASTSWDDEPGGFDEAQIETSRRAAQTALIEEEEPVDREPMMNLVHEAATPNRWVRMLILAVVIVVLGVGGYAGWMWWQGQQAAPVQVTTTRTRTHKLAVPGVAQRPATTATLSPSSATTTTPVPAAGLTVAATPATTHATTTTAAPIATSTNAAPASATQAAVATTTRAPRPATTTTAPVRIAATKPAPTPRAVTITPAPATSTTRVERTPAGSPTITNAGAASSPNDPLRARYEAMARQNLANPNGNYTVQFELVCQTASLTRAINEGGEKLWFVPVSYKGQQCYRVFWGRYATKDQATSAASEIPAAMRGSKPVVVSVPKQ